jgi:hypothetical protein
MDIEIMFNRWFNHYLYFLAILFAAVGFAQAPTAMLTGRILDSTGAVIAGAKVTITHIETNETRTAISDSQGSFTVTNLALGRHSVVTEKSGFRRLEETGLELQVNQQARLDFTLEVGAVTESVEVTAAAPVLNTENGIKGEVISNQEITQMPLDGRNVTDLALLVPQVLPSEGSNIGSPITVNGARNDNNNFYIDGINNNSFRMGTSMASVPLDAIQEFKMLTNSYSAEYGRLAGGVMTMALKTGGNQFHGSVFEFLRNDKLDARNFFAANKDKLRRNQFGSGASGPILIPKIFNGRDRAFFLVSWESYREVTGSSLLAQTPTLLQRQGDFSQTLDTNGKLVLVRDPLASGTCSASDKTACFAGNRIPADRFNPVAAKLLPYFPLPNLPGQVNNLLVSAVNQNNWDNFMFKVDYRLTSKDSLSVRHTQRFIRGINPFNGSDYGNFGAKTANGNMLAGITYTRMFSAAFINEFRVGFARAADRARSADYEVNGAALLGIPGTTTQQGFLGFPTFNINNLSAIGDNSVYPYLPTVNNFTYADTVTWVKGEHLIKFGGEILHGQAYQPYPQNARGNLNITSATTGYAFSDFLLGYINQSTRQVGVAQNYFYQTTYGAFIQDDFRVRRNLTLNLGIRYDLPKPPLAKYGRFANFLLDKGLLVIASDESVPNLKELLASAGLTGKVALASQYGLPPTLVQTNRHNFAPRAGFAWRPTRDNRTVVRSGYGIFYAGSEMNSLRNQLGNSYPFTITQQFQRVASNPGLVTLSNPFPDAVAQVAGVTNTAAYQENAPSQYLQSWNLTIEREIGKGTAIEAGYAGSKGTHLGHTYNINQPYHEAQYAPNFPVPYPSFGTINYISFGSNSAYNSGTVTIRRRFSNSLFFRASYIYSKSIDDASQLLGAATGGYAGTQDARNPKLDRARSDWDVGHSFTTTFTYETPVALGRYLRGWQLAGSGRMNTGRPFTVMQTGNINQGIPNRPDRLAKGTSASPSAQSWFDTGAFVTVPSTAYRFGNSGRNILDGPGYVAMNLSLSKRFAIRERQSLQVRWEAFNFTNHTDFNQPQNNISNFNVASIVSAKPARTIQLGLRYQF